MKSGLSMINVLMSGNACGKLKVDEMIKATLIGENGVNMPFFIMLKPGNKCITWTDCKNIIDRRKEEIAKTTLTGENSVSIAEKRAEFISNNIVISSDEQHEMKTRIEKIEPERRVMLKVTYPEHGKVVLENRKGDTYTSRSTELMDFLSGVYKSTGCKAEEERK